MRYHLGKLMFLTSVLCGLVTLISMPAFDPGHYRGAWFGLVIMGLWAWALSYATGYLWWEWSECGWPRAFERMAISSARPGGSRKTTPFSAPQIVKYPTGLRRNGTS